jgi:antitoxin ParD1/3/4
MAEISFSVPDSMSAFAADRVHAGRYGDAGEYFRELVRREQERHEAEAQLRERLARSEASGISDRKVPEIVADIESRLDLR